jgi:hypothetical protein
VTDGQLPAHPAGDYGVETLQLHPQVSAMRIQKPDGGRNRDRTYDLCDVNVRLKGLEIGLRSRVWRNTSILPQQQLFRLPGPA